ncbi:MAG TPA: peptide ABC transporter substrate-binding protein [Candidatus Paceibacterota bacterium]|nr:peptide ABC transporter substrate-binding protein [Candidatus Paceibacterota bacterium]
MFKKIFLSFTRRERIVFFIALGAAIVSGASLVGAGLTAATRDVPAAGGDYAEGAVGQPIYVNPVIASSQTDKSLFKLVFANLGELAQSITMSQDGRTWDVRLKENLKWQDGQQLTSDDVIFTVQEIQDPATQSPLAASWQGVSASRVSELELQFSLINPYAFFGDTVNALYPIPKHLFVDTPPANWKLSDYNLKPVGSGPYQFVNYDKRPDGFITDYKLAAWKSFPGTAALIQNFDFRFFAQTDDLISHFNSGAIDGLASLDSANLASVKRPYELIPFKLPSYYGVFLNQSQSLPLQDAAVRNALNLLTDRNALVNAALGGHGSPAIGPIPENSPNFDHNLVPTSTLGGADALSEASATLDAAGWVMTSSSFREKKIGGQEVPLELTLTVPQIDFLETTANLLQSAWQSAGFKIDQDVEPADALAANAVKNRSYEMLLFGNILGPSDDLYSFWNSSQRFYPGLNLAIYNSATADSLINSIRQELDPAKRAANFIKLQDTIVNSAPAIFLYSPDYLYIADKNLHGAQGGTIADPSDIFGGTAGWYLNTARVLK